VNQDILKLDWVLRHGSTFSCRQIDGTASRFAHDDCADVALGVPSRNAPGLMSTGGVFVLTNTTSVLFRDGFDP
jgi:hypothetical protein